MHEPLTPRPRVSSKVGRFTESVIREMNREAFRVGAVNLSAGLPDHPTPAEVKEAAVLAIAADMNQYAITWGAREMREAIAEKTAWHLGLQVDPEREITVTCGATEAMIAAMMAIVDPGDEVIVFEPFYENYGPDAILADATPRYVPLRAPDWSFDPDELRAAFNERTRCIVICNPHNPTGKVFSREELETIAALCVEHDVICLSDEIYEHILYDGATHTTVAAIEGMRDRTVVINSMSKTYSVTGWRIGWTIAPPDLTDGIRKVHDFLTVGASTPLQMAGAQALRLPRSYYGELAEWYQVRRDMLVEVLRGVGFVLTPPAGAYYVLCDISPFADLGYHNDVEFARYLIRDVGVAAVPASPFFSPGNCARVGGDRLVRFAFCKHDATLRAAAERLASLGAVVA